MELETMKESNEEHAENFHFFSNLPDEIVFEIFQFLDVITIIRLRRVSRKWSTLLRDETAFRSVILVEKPHQQNYQCHISEVVDNVRRYDVWKHVKHIHLIGDYDLSNEEPHAGIRPFPPSELFEHLLQLFSRTKKEHTGEFEKLSAIEVRNAAVELNHFKGLRGESALKCWFTVRDASVVFNKFDWFSLEFPVIGSRSFDLCGDSVWVKNKPELHLSREKELIDVVRPSIPVEIAELIIEACYAATVAPLAGLGDVYSTLLKGRRGMMVREDVVGLFMEAFESGLEHDLPRPHWQHCRNYNFQDHDRLTRYALAYYSKPRNFYQVYKEGREWTENEWREVVDSEHQLIEY